MAAPGLVRRCAWVLTACLLTLATASSETQRAPPRAPSGVTGFHRGVNILGYDRYWDDPRRASFTVRDFVEIRRAGFDFVRVNLFIFPHLDPSGKIDEDWLKRLDWVVGTAGRNGLGVILDEHDSGECAKDSLLCMVKLRRVWQQLALRYAQEPRSVAFELLNEPGGKIDADAWNRMVAELLRTIRASNPLRPVVVDSLGVRKMGPGDVPPLPADDRNIVLTFHYYSPYRFTHQGAKFGKVRDVHGVTWGDSADRQTLHKDFDRFARLAAAVQRPMLLGEYGVYDKSGTPVEQRAAWVGAVACEAERHNFSWSYWQFQGDFALWDEAADAWVQPIKDALLPPKGANSVDRRC